MANNYGGNFTSFSEYLQQNQVRQDRQRYPFYTDNADYNTNSKSYYDDLARKTKLIEILAHRIWEYDEELAKRFEEWDKNLEEFPEDVENLLIEWLEDGTLEDIINDNIFNKLNNKIDTIKDIEFNFKYKDYEPRFYTTLGLYRNAVNQSINIDDETNRIYATQARNDDGYIISEMSPSGVRLSKMEIDGGGHSTLIGLDRITNGELKIWSLHEATGKLIQFKYEPDGRLTMGDAKSMTDFMPESLKNSSYKVNVTFDKYHDNLMFCNGWEVETRKREDIRNRVDKIHKKVSISEDDYNLDANSIRHMQGAITYGDTLYWLSGNGEQSSIPVIARYDMKENKRLDDYKLDNIPGLYGKYNMRDDFSEPEGLAYYVNPITGKHSILFAITTGGSLKRYTNVYTLDQRNAEQHWQSMVNVGIQKYSMIHADGRAWELPEKMNDLNYWLKPGYYFIRNVVYDELKNTPYPGGGANWWLKVYPTDQYNTRKEVLWRHSYGRKNITFERSRNENSNENGTWNIVHKSHLGNAENIQADDWGGKLNQVDIPGEYYISTARSNEFKDFPEEYKNFTGWFLTVSDYSSGNSFMQTLTRNSNVYTDQFRRIVKKGENVEWQKTGGSPRWFEMKLTSNARPDVGSGKTPLYGKVNDIVYLRGVIYVDNYNTVITTLPEDYRPRRTLRLQFLNSQGYGVIGHILSNGDISISSKPENPNSYITLDGSFFFRDGLSQFD